MNKENNYIKIFDTTLRDGEQSPGASMNIEEKLKIAEALEDLKVDIIEAGFPAASKGDYEAVSEISKKIKNSSICALSRASKNDIQTNSCGCSQKCNGSKNTYIYLNKRTSHET